jgi:hypothetical protein
MREFVQLFTYWSFAPITYIERLCLQSMLDAGHPVTVYTYERHLDVPAGVHVADAANILLRSRVIDGPSPSLFSNLFRYVGLQRGLGTWVDADVLMFRSIADMGENIFGWEDEKLINGAILRMPPNAPVLRDLVRHITARVPIDPRWGWREKARQVVRGFLGRPLPIGKMEWGVAGPDALTHFGRRYDLAKWAQPVDVFYPVPAASNRPADMFNPDIDIEACFTARTRTIHLWNYNIKDRKGTSPPAGSFIDRMCQRHRIAAP